MVKVCNLISLYFSMINKDNMVNANRIMNGGTLQKRKYETCSI